MRWAGAAVLLFAAGVFASDHLLGDPPFSRRGRPVFTDHLAFYTAGRLVRDGRAGDLYDLSAVARYQADLFPGRWDALEAFRNPPFFALPFALTAGLPYAASGWLWTLVGVAVFAGGLLVLDRRPPFWAVATVPAVLCVVYGQTSLASVGILAAVGRLLVGRRPFPAGVVAGLLWFKPPLLLGLVVWGLLDVRRLWPAAAGCVLTGAALTAGSWLVVPEAWEAFVGTLGGNTAFDRFDWWKAPGPRAFWRLLLGPGTLATGLWLLSAAAGFWGFWRVWRANRDRPAVGFAAAVLLTLWASPHALVYDWAILSVPAVLLARHAPGDWRTVWAVAWAGLAVGTDLGMAQEWAWGGPVVQVATPALAWCGWRTVRKLSG